MLVLMLLCFLGGDGGTIILKNGRQMEYTGTYKRENGFVAFTSPAGEVYRFPEGAVDFEASEKKSNRPKKKRKTALVIGNEQVEAVSLARQYRKRFSGDRYSFQARLRNGWASMSPAQKEESRKRLRKMYREVSASIREMDNNISQKKIQLRSYRNNNPETITRLKNEVTELELVKQFLKQVKSRIRQIAAELTIFL